MWSEAKRFNCLRLCLYAFVSNLSDVLCIAEILRPLAAYACGPGRNPFSARLFCWHAGRLVLGTPACALLCNAQAAQCFRDLEQSHTPDFDGPKGNLG